MRHKLSVTQLTDPKDITDRASRYCLVAQEQDIDGELETKLYKVSTSNFSEYKYNRKIGHKL